MCSLSAGFGATSESFAARAGAAMARATASIRSEDSGWPLPVSCLRNSSLKMTAVVMPRLAPRPKAAEEERRVGSPEAEGVRQRELDPAAPRHVGNVVEVALGIGRLVVHRGRNLLISKREDGDSRFEPPGSAEEMAGHGLRRAHR